MTNKKPPKAGKLLKKTFLIFIAATVIAVFSAGVYSSAERTAEVKTAIHALNAFTDETVRLIGSEPTADSINPARRFVDERKDFVKKQFAALETAGYHRKDPEIGMEIERSKLANLDKIAEIYDDFQAKAIEDVERLNQSKEQISKSSGNARRELEARQNEQIKIIRKNVETLNALDDLVKSYRTIFEDK